MFRRPMNGPVVRRRRVIRGAVLALAVIFGINPAYANCTVVDIVAFTPVSVDKSVRVLHSELMVAGLSCKARDMFNSFATNYRAQLAIHAKGLRRHFREANGQAHQKPLDRFVTQTANRAAMRHVSDNYAFCRETRHILREMLQQSDRPLALYGIRHTAVVWPEILEAHPGAVESGTVPDCLPDDGVARNP